MGAVGACRCILVCLCSIWCVLLGLSLLAAGVVVYIKFPSIVDEQINERVTIQPGHATYEQLQEPTLPVWKSFSFFNLTNPEDFQNGEMAQLEEVGPYSYTEIRTKEFIEFSEENDQVTYNQTKLFFFDPDTSGDGLSEDDVICTINIPLVAAVGQFQQLSPLVRLIAKPILNGIFSSSGAQLYICQPPTDLAWNYTDNLIQQLHTDPLLGFAGLNYPRDHVSIQANNSVNDSNPSIILTGVANITTLGQFIQWNGHEGSVDIWPGETANLINGTEGLFFHPNLKEGEPLQAFKDDVVRSFDLTYSGKIKHLGLQTHRYRLANTTFESAFSNPDNARWGSWCPDGLIYLGPTQIPEVPIFGSKPRFLDGDPLLREQFAGMPEPNIDDDDTTIDVEPNTGALVNLKQQLQVNVQVNRTDDFSQFSNIVGFNGTDTLYYPVLYVNEHAELTPDFKQYLESKGLSEVFLFQKLVPAMLGVLVVLAVVCFLAAIIVALVLLKKASSVDTEPEKLPLVSTEI